MDLPQLIIHKPLATSRKTKMKNLILIIILILLTGSCKQNSEGNSESKQVKSDTILEKIKERGVKIPDSIFISKFPDSLELISSKILKGDYNGDGKMDFTSMLNNKNDNQKGVIIVHNSDNYEVFIFGAGRKINQSTNLRWIQIFENIPKGEVVAPTLVDSKTGDIMGPDESQNFELIGNGILMDVEETHGGGIIFWNGKKYEWYHVE